MKEQTAKYDPLIGLTIDLDPGDYVLLSKADWDKIKEFAKTAEGDKPDIQLMELNVPDPGPPVCDECGSGMWMHSSCCSKIGGRRCS